MTEQTPAEPDPRGLRFLSREQLLRALGQQEFDRRLDRLAARRRGDPPEEAEVADRPAEAAEDAGGSP